MNYTYAQYVGICDIVLIILTIILIIVGAKKGFLLKSLNILKKFCGLLVAVLFCVKFANGVFYPLFGNKMNTYFYNNIMSNETFASISTQEEAVSTLKTLGIPEFLSNFIINSQNIDVSNVASNIALNLANLVTTVILVVCAFLTLWLGTKLIFLILKLCAKLLRTSVIVRVVDGILGICLYLILYYVALQLIMFIVVIITNRTSNMEFINFIIYDVRGLTSGLGENYHDRFFSICGWLYTNNFLANLIGLLF